MIRLIAVLLAWLELSFHLKLDDGGDKLDAEKALVP